MMANEQKQAPQQMHPAAVACEFMQRADLKGGEVDAFAQTYNWLQSILQGELAVLPSRMHEDLTETVNKYRNKFGELEDEASDETPPEDHPDAD